MNDLIDIKSKLKYSESSTKIFDKTLLYEKLENEILKSWESWGKFQQQWCHNAYDTFKDYDKFLVLIYLFRQVMQSYSDKFQSLSMQEFYSHNEFVIDKINLIQISEDLKIPKETIRRKINEFENMEILKRHGKQIILNKSVIQYQIPSESIVLLSVFIEKQTEILQSIKSFGNSLTKNQIKAYFEKFFTVFWLRFYELQIPYLIRWRKIFKDLETFNVWGVVALNHQYNLNKKHAKSIYKNTDEIKIDNFYSSLSKVKVNHGINASSISDVSNIPRATVIRKLTWLKKENMVKRNKELEYMMNSKGKENKKINENFKENCSVVTSFVVDIVDLIKNSDFKI